MFSRPWLVPPLAQPSPGGAGQAEVRAEGAGGGGQGGGAARPGGPEELHHLLLPGRLRPRGAGGVAPPPPGEVVRAYTITSVFQTTGKFQLATLLRYSPVSLATSNM